VPLARPGSTLHETQRLSAGQSCPAASLKHGNRSGAEAGAWIVVGGPCV